MLSLCIQCTIKVLHWKHCKQYYPQWNFTFSKKLQSYTISENVINCNNTSTWKDPCEPLLHVHVHPSLKLFSFPWGAFCEALIWCRTAWDLFSTTPSCVSPFLYEPLFHTHINGTPTLLEFIWTVLFVICLWAPMLSSQYHFTVIASPESLMSKKEKQQWHGSSDALDYCHIISMCSNKNVWDIPSLFNYCLWWQFSKSYSCY